MDSQKKGSHRERLGEILDQASELPPEHRPGFIINSCADDPALRDEALQLTGTYFRAASSDEAYDRAERMINANFISTLGLMRALKL